MSVESRLSMLHYDELGIIKNIDMKKPHYYYRIAATSNVGEKLQEFMHRCQEAEEKARAWADKQGASRYYESPEGMAGGVSAVEFADAHARDGWDKEVLPGGHIFFFPMEGTDLEKEMNALPVVSETELIGIMNLQPKRTKDNRPLPMTFGNSTPIVFLHHGYWYADMPYASGDFSFTPIAEQEFYRRRMATVNELK